MATDDTDGLDDTSLNSSVFTPNLVHEQAVSVHRVKGSSGQS